MQIGYSVEHKGTSIFDANMLKLKKDEKARICVLQDKVTVGLSHWVDFGKDNKSTGYYKCLAKYEEVYGAGGNGSDPQNCPFCKHGVKNGKIGQVSRRFVTNIIKYVTDLKGKPRVPLNVDAMVWRFGDDKYNRIVDIVENYGVIQQIDLGILCENEGYQRFQIDPIKLEECLWLNSGEEIKKAVAELFNTSKVEVAKLELLLGQEVSKEIALEYTNNIMGISSIAEPVSDVQKLLDGTPTVTGTKLQSSDSEKPPKEPIKTQDFSDLLNT
ncbi:MAG TPA: hypothetical protein ENI23_08085 [bacterium]|nr:hypothetical protein [bacterium]